MNLIISGRGLGKRHKALFDDFSVPFPPDLNDDGGLTLGELITRIVLSEVDAFVQRQEQRRLTRILSPAQIETGLQKGKVDPGDKNLSQTIDAGAAVSNALQAFEDGLYLVFIDDHEKRELNAHVFIKPESRITFIRLVFLAGA